MNTKTIQKIMVILGGALLVMAVAFHVNDEHPNLSTLFALAGSFLGFGGAYLGHFISKRLDEDLKKLNIKSGIGYEPEEPGITSKE